jgi:hypothetical protein
MGGGRDVGDRKVIAGEPAPALDEIADIVEMMGQVRVSGANRQRVRLPLTRQAFHHLFAEQVLGHLEVHLDVEPAGKAPHFGAIDRIDADQHLLAVDLVEVLDNGRGVGEHGAVRLDHHRHFAGRVEGEELRPPFPDLFGLQGEIEVLFPEYDAHFARKRRKPKVIEDPHAGILIPAGAAAHAQLRRALLRAARAAD